jgi:hypothetical protein
VIKENELIRDEAINVFDYFALLAPSLPISVVTFILAACADSSLHSWSFKLFGDLALALLKARLFSLVGGSGRRPRDFDHGLFRYYRLGRLLRFHLVVRVYDYDDRCVGGLLLLDVHPGYYSNTKSIKSL